MTHAKNFCRQKLPSQGDGNCTDAHIQSCRKTFRYINAETHLLNNTKKIKDMRMHAATLCHMLMTHFVHCARAAQCTLFRLDSGVDNMTNLHIPVCRSAFCMSETTNSHIGTDPSVFLCACALRALQCTLFRLDSGADNMINLCSLVC